MTRKGWYEALANALQKEDNAVVQLATVDASGTPRVRTLIQRDFITASSLPTLPLILSTTDIRTPKVAELNLQRRVELVYWMPTTQEQFRILGRVSIVPAPGYAGTYPGLCGVVYEALEREGFDWEAKRLAVFDGMSGHLRATWCRPVSGAPMDEEERKAWPVTLPRLGEATNEREKRDLETALANFVLLVVEPFVVDWTALPVGDQPDKRTRFERDWEDEGCVEFKETSVVP